MIQADLKDFLSKKYLNIFDFGNQRVSINWIFLTVDFIQM